MRSIVRFAAVMGPLSSVFDLPPSRCCSWCFKQAPEVFRTGWFVESIATQTLVVFLIRTHGRPWRDRPDPVLATTSLGALAVALVIPFSAAGAWFGFQVPPLAVTGAIAAIVAAYLLAAELAKPLALKASAARPAPRRS